MSCFLVRLKSTRKIRTHFFHLGPFLLTKLWVLHPYFETALPSGHLVTQALRSMSSSLEDFTLLFLPLESVSLGSSEAILLISFQTLFGLFLPVDVPHGSIYPPVSISPPLLPAPPHLLLPLSIFFLLSDIYTDPPKPCLKSPANPW